MTDNPTISPIQDAKKRRRPEACCQSTRTETRFDLAIEPQKLCSAFGVDDTVVATGLLSRLVSALNPSADGLNATVVNEAIALIGGISPTGVLESMTSTLMLAAQHAALDCFRRAMHPDQTPGGRSMYLSLALKASRTYAELLTAFNQGRGKGITRQEIVIQRINVETGAQAVVGATTGGGG